MAVNAKLGIGLALGSNSFDWNYNISRPKRVLIFGAGLAGLSSAYELTKLGHDVIILEGSSRIGGRVLTLRNEFTDGLYADAGATRIADNHHWVKKYTDQFSLTLDPFHPDQLSDLYFVNGKRYTANISTKDFDLNIQELSLDLNGLRKKYLTDVLPSLGNAGIPEVPPDSLSKYDKLTYLELLKSEGASPAAIKLLTLGASENNASALQRLRALTWRAKAKWSKIRGGNDLLVHSLAGQLKGKIHLDCPVVKLSQTNMAVEATCLQKGTYRVYEADFAICTIPFSVLKDIDTSSAFSPQKQNTIRSLQYSPVTKIFLQTKTRIWNKVGLSGFSVSDLPMMETWDLSYSQPGKKGILMAYITSPVASIVESFNDQNRIKWMVKQTEKLFPGIGKDFELGTSKAWGENIWSRGAYPTYLPNQVISLYPQVCNNEGRIYFAGGHASVWPGWMQGALESGNRAASAIDRIH